MMLENVLMKPSKNSPSLIGFLLRIGFLLTNKTLKLGVLNIQMMFGLLSEERMLCIIMISFLQSLGDVSPIGNLLKSWRSDYGN